jgi:hypothetical protein
MACADFLLLPAYLKGCWARLSSRSSLGSWANTGLQKYCSSTAADGVNNKGQVGAFTIAMLLRSTTACGGPERSLRDRTGQRQEMALPMPNETSAVIKNNKKVATCKSHSCPRNPAVPAATVQVVDEIWAVLHAQHVAAFVARNYQRQ